MRLLHSSHLGTGSHQPALPASALPFRSTCQAVTAPIHPSQPRRPKWPRQSRIASAPSPNGHPRPQPHRSSCYSPQRQPPVRAVGLFVYREGWDDCGRRRRREGLLVDMLGSGLNLVSAALGFGMTAAFVAFVCARFICCRPRRADPRAPPLGFDADLPADLDRPLEHARSGLEPLVVAAIPTMKYNCEAFHSKDDALCSICLGEYKEKEILRIIPTCRHDFHLACLDVWLQKQTTCPICRISLKELPGGKAAISPARSIPQLPALPVNSVNPTHQWFLPIHQDHRGQQNSPDTHESVEVVIEIRQ